MSAFPTTSQIKKSSSGGKQRQIQDHNTQKKGLFYTHSANIANVGFATLRYYQSVPPE